MDHLLREKIANAHHLLLLIVSTKNGNLQSASLKAENVKIAKENSFARKILSISKLQYATNSPN